MRGRTSLIWLAATFAGEHLARWLGPLAIVAPGACAAAVLLLKRRRRSGPGLLTAGFMLIGIVLALLWLASASGGALASLAKAGGHVVIEGRIVSAPAGNSGTTAAFIEAVEAYAGNNAWATREIVYLTARGSLAPEVIYQGVTVRASGKLERAGPWDGWLRDRGAWSRLRCRAAAVRPVAPSPDPVSSAIAAARRWLSGAYRRLFDGRSAGLLEGVTISKLDACDPGLLADLRACGLSHIVAVSGLHVGSAAVLVLGVCALAGAGRRTGYLLASASAAMVAALAGFRVSALRAAVMAGTASAGRLFGRRYDAAGALSVAGIAILCTRPSSAFEPGFQYSFAAAAGIVILARSKAASGGGRIHRAAAACAGAQLGTVPLVLLRGEAIPVSALAANLLVVWLVGPLLVSALAAAAISAVSPSAAGVASVIPGVIARYVMWVASALARVPETGLFMGGLGVLTLTLYFFALVCLARGRGPRGAFAAAVALFLVVALILLGCFPVLGRRGGDSMVALDVGEGDATLLRDSSGGVALVDGGPDPELLLRRLRAAGVSKVDLAICSHRHADHVEGFKALVERMPVGRMIGPPPGKGERGPYERLISAARREGVAVSIAVAGDRVEVSPGILLEVLSAPEKPPRPGEEENNRSIVCMATVGGARILLPGDLESTAQHRLLEGGSDLSCEVLKMPHHGSSNAVGSDLLKAARPRVATISAGRNNRMGHPSRKCIRELRKRGIRVERTDQTGDIVIRFAKRTVSEQPGGR